MPSGAPARSTKPAGSGERPPATAPLALRAASALLYGLFCALGFGLCARPAWLELRGLGLAQPALPWEVPLGRAHLLLAALLAAWTLRLSLATALERRLALAERAALLLCVGLALLLRMASGEPLPPRDPEPALVAALRESARLLDDGYRELGRYEPAKAGVDAALAGLQAPGFQLRGRPLPSLLCPLFPTTGPQRSPLAGDPPGTVYAAIGEDRQRAWLTVVTLDRLGRPQLLSQGGRPLVVEARSGTHGAAGRDPAVPVYPTLDLRRPAAGAPSR
jgi:hypothetical protein